MRSPEHRSTKRTGHTFENEASSRYRAPGAFTVLPPEDEVPPEPPTAPQPYRLTPSSRRHKNMSFAILAEPSSTPGSRSPSPTGRVSPFRGRGFNPAGSRHASPSTSPPPSGSKIPRLSRRGSAAAFGEKVTEHSSPARRKLNSELSRSLNDVTAARPPPTPRRVAAFQRLSPIAGSSPEPSQSQSSPKVSKLVGKPPPGKNPTSPTRIPMKSSYRNVQPKVNSFSRTNNKPKVPPKPQVISEGTTESDEGPKKRVVRRGSVTARTNSKNTLVSSNNNKNSTSSSNKGVKNGTKSSKDNNGNSLTKTAVTEDKTKSPQKSKVTEAPDQPTNNNTPTATKSDSSPKLSDLLQPSTTTVVSTTTTTVTQPLKIEAKIDTDKPVAPIVDGRVLSATSVSNAMNRMNDTVINTQTLMKETGLTKLSPAASTIIAMSNEEKKPPPNPALDTKNATTALPTVEEAPKKPAANSNHVTSTGILPSARVLEEHVQNNMSNMAKSANERIIEARTIVPEPIQITVREKPMDVEVQSGNIRFEASNGLGERPGLPPPHQPSNDAPPEPQEPPGGNVCTRFLATCKKKMSCKRDKNQPENKEEGPKTTEDTEKTGCFNCRKKPKPAVTISVEQDPSEEPKKKFWDRLKCCGKNKIGDTGGCFAGGRRKGSWVDDRRDSILSGPPPPVRSGCSRACCGFLRRMFCLDKCRRKSKIEMVEDSRRASMMSKKKSLTPSVPVEDVKPKIDESLVEHSSQMKAAIPVLPVYLAYFCLVMNCILPGTGTVFSGMFCLCIGKARFSQKDSVRSRIGAFIINLVIGFGQFFTILFCLVGWGWSIWWGVIMLKLAKKHKKLKALEDHQRALEGSRPAPAANQNHASRDPERGS